MFDQIFERSDALRRQLASPLREARLAYLRHRAEQGAPRSTLRKLAQYLLVATERLNLQRCGTVTTAQIERAADQWAHRRVKHHKIKGGFSRKSKSCFVCVATNWLRFVGRLQASETRQHRFAQIVADFARYLEQERGLAPRTIITRCWVAEDFLGRALHPKRALHEITIRRIDEVLARKGTEGGYSRRGIQSYASGLRTFFRYAEQENLCHRGFADCIKAPRIYRNETLPTSPSWEDVQRLLANTEGSSSTSIRDRAILMLLVVYGLRAGEVRSLCLEDIDWESDCFHLQRSKTRRTQILPLTATVGVAILRYLKRPQAFVPYIYSREELKRLLEGALTYQKNRGRLEPLVVQTLLLFLYGTALRVRESLVLTQADVDLAAGVVTVRESKFFKSRLVPLGPHLLTALVIYASRRKVAGHSQDGGAPFFIARNGRPINMSTLQGNFLRIRNHVGIHRTDGACYQPRIHDLRHTFAVHRLVAWYREGAEVQRLLPYLSVFLGHAYLAATSVYLPMTPELLAEASKRFEQHALKGAVHD